MVRSVWKAKIFSNKLLKEFNKSSFYNSKNLFFTSWDKNLDITSSLVGFRIFLYNGQSFSSIKVSDNMVNRKLGEFVFTKKLGSGIHVNKSKKK